MSIFVRVAASVMALAAITSLFAAEMTEQQRLSFRAHDECADRCQVQLDQQLFACFKEREQSNTAVPENCKELAYESNAACMHRCPVNARDSSTQ